jgi:myosin heavy subunit
MWLQLETEHITCCRHSATPARLGTITLRDSVNICEFGSRYIPRPSVTQSDRELMHFCSTLLCSQDGVAYSAEMVHYLLEKSRVVNHEEAERSYHVFYQLFAGAHRSTLNGLMLDPSVPYRFLGMNPPAAKIRPDDSSNFFDLVNALSEIGMGLKTQNDIFRLIASILHLGDFSFEEGASGDDGRSTSTLTRTPCADFVCGVLGIPFAELSSALTSRTVKTNARRSVYSVPLSVDQVRVYMTPHACA